MPPQLIYSPAPEDSLRLVEIRRDNCEAVMHLKPAESQRGFVAENAVSIVQGLYCSSAWFRAVYRNSGGGEGPVGFVMLHDPRCGSQDEASFYPQSSVPRDGLFLWRLMVGEAFQGQGIGRQLIALLVRLARANGFDRLYLSYVDAPGGPAPFYAACGFKKTGRIVDGEVEAVLELAEGAGPGSSE